MEKEVQKTIDEILAQIRPFLNGHGGDIEVLGLEDKVLKVRLLGVCTHCESSRATIDAIEQIFIQNLPNDIEKMELA
jgi:Fe-S cluster biogenesis protein NfuA